MIVFFFSSLSSVVLEEDCQICRFVQNHHAIDFTPDSNGLCIDSGSTSLQLGLDVHLPVQEVKVPKDRRSKCHQNQSFRLGHRPSPRSSLRPSLFTQRRTHSRTDCYIYRPLNRSHQRQHLPFMLHYPCSPRRFPESFSSSRKGSRGPIMCCMPELRWTKNSSTM